MPRSGLWLFMLSLITLIFFACTPGPDGEGDDQAGKDCCDCLIEEDCWGYGLCPADYHCYCIYDDTFTGTCPSMSDQCFAADTECKNTKCADACEGVID